MGIQKSCQIVNAVLLLTTLTIPAYSDSGSATSAPSGKPSSPSSRVYVDARGNVHLVTVAKGDVRLTKGGHFRDPQLSPDGRTVGALATALLDQGSGTADSVEVSGKLWIWRDSRVIRRLEPGGYIRAWGFANGGAAVGVYSGGLHFAGFYVLYDVATGKELANAEDPVSEQSPGWVRDLSP